MVGAVAWPSPNRSRRTNRRALRDQREPPTPVRCCSLGPTERRPTSPADCFCNVSLFVCLSTCICVPFCLSFCPAMRLLSYLCTVIYRTSEARVVCMCAYVSVTLCICLSVFHAMRPIVLFYPL